MTSVSLHMISLSFFAYIVMAVTVAITSVVILMLCARGKKQNSVTMIRYVKNDELDVGSMQRSGSSLRNGLTGFEEENEKRASQHSLPNEGRNLPTIPDNNDMNDGSSNPGPSSRNDVSSTESFHQNTRTSPKKSTTRRLPALPPEQVEVPQEAESLQQKNIESTYEDMRDENNVESIIQIETVGSGDSALYAKVPEDLNKRTDDDTDLYAQVGSVEVAESQPGTSGANVVSRKESSSSEEDQNMDSPTAVTYASVDKMKKTMSVKRKRENSTSSSSLGGAPPVPERNFDDDDMLDSPQDLADLPPPPAIEILQDVAVSSSAVENHAAASPESNEQIGPAYDTVSVRESLAHQRLRQMVEDEQRNRYVNTSRAPDGVDLYSQISEDHPDPEALYESVSVPGSADGTVGITGQSIAPDVVNGTRRTRREDGYSTIGATAQGNSDAPAQSHVVLQRNQSNSSNLPSPPSGMSAVNPNYENF